MVLPIYNEADSIEKLYHRLCKVLSSIGRSYEMLFVDDGSSDESVAILKRVAADDPAVRLIQMRRNFGQTAALAAGFDAARGSVILAMDADLQHDPYEIPLFLEKIDEGYDIASGWRARRADNFWLRRIPSMIANRLMKHLSGVDIHDFGTTFKAYRAEVIKGIRLYGDLHRFIPALASSMGAKVAEVPIKNINRRFGKSNYGLDRTVRVMFDLVLVKFLLSYLARPLHFFGLMGLVCFMGGTATGFYILLEKFVGGQDVMDAHGPLLLLSVLLLIVAVIFISMGLLGEVLSRIYFESSGRRIYHVRGTWQGGHQEKG